MRHPPAASVRRRLFVHALAIAALALVLRPYVRAERATRAALGGADRYLTAVSTDKPLYRPGEKVRVRGVILNAFDRTPLREAAVPLIEIKGPKGETVASGNSTSDGGVWAFAWPVPEAQAGGEYTIRATYPWNGHAPAERKFDVRVFRAPRLKSQIVFLRDGYGPGDKVTATLEVTRAEGGAPAGAKVTATARVDGGEVARVPASVDERGRCSVSFVLPAVMARGEGALSFAIEDGGVVETAAKTIPILLQTLDLSLAPEGGELVAGVATRVYFEARTPARKPADIAGVIVDQKGGVVARFRSEHEGRGRFDLTPAAGARYTLRVEQPAGIKTTWPLPNPVDGGVALRAGADLTAAGASVKLLLASARGQKVKVTLSHREEEISSTVVTLQAGRPPAEVWLASPGAEGVLTATVWDQRGTPVAERLIYRAPARNLKIDLRTDKPSYLPGDTVKLTARATRDGQPVAALLGLTVTDDAVLEMIEKREQAPSLPVMVLLEPEVRELADAEIYLDPKNPKAPLALDLLLGTQGWRRFAVMNVAQLIERYGDDARRALALRIQARVEKARARALMEDDQMNGAMVFGGIRKGAGLPMMMPAPAGAPAIAIAIAVPAPPPAPPKHPVASQAAVEPVRQELDRAIERRELAAADHAVFAKRKMRPEAARQDLVVVREYAHAVRPGRLPTDRLDFTETLFWQAAARTDAKTGEVTVSFGLNDSVTSFKAFANGFDAAGALGAATATIRSVQPFYVEPKLPLEVTAGDTIQLPVSLINGTDDTLRASVKASAEGGLRLAPLPRLELLPHQRARQLLEIGVGAAQEHAALTLRATAGAYADTVTRQLAVRPNGFPFRESFAGLTAAGGVVAHTLRIPAGLVPGSLKTSLAVYPTPLANMTQALARLIQEPNGCFEQTSSTTYPLTMAQQYFTSHTGVDPKLVAAAQEKLDAGYKRLVGFECSQHGYEWFGENPGHEALTAYGLLHFTDMAKVRPVDQVMIARSRDWLLAQRDGQGGFTRKRRALHSWVEDRDSSNGYILWALLESGQRGLEREIGAFKTAAAASPNSYVAALGANVMAMAGDAAAAHQLMERLATRQDHAGLVQGATTSIVGSGGESLAIETTALATLAWLREPAFAGAVERAMKYLAESCQDGRYGSTQSTVLALRAIVAYDHAHARPKAPGRVSVLVDGQPIGAAVAFDRATQGAIQLPDIASRLTAGAHRIEVKMEGGSPMPYSVGVEYSARTPDSAKACQVGLTVKLSRTTIPEGELVEADVAIANRSAGPVPTPVAIIGLPGGLEPRHDQLKELVKKGLIDAYEVLGRDVVLYWRGLEAGQKVAVPLSLVASVPGRYTGAASRAYLYYTDEQKIWVGGLQATITPASGRAPL
jgi:hypothetical protein